IAVPGIWSVISQVTVSHGRESDVSAPVPLVWLALGALASLGVWGTGFRRTRPLALASGSVLTAGAVGLGLAIYLDIPVTHYYPSKSLWQAALLSIPLVIALLTIALDKAFQRVSLLSLRVGTVGVAA